MMGAQSWNVCKRTSVVPWERIKVKEIISLESHILEVIFIKSFFAIALSKYGGWKCTTAIWILMALASQALGFQKQWSDLRTVGEGLRLEQGVYWRLTILLFMLS